MAPNVPDVAGTAQTTERTGTGRVPAATGPFPRRRLLIIGLSALAGFALTVVWSAQFVDRTIGGGIADTMLGEDAHGAPLTGTLGGIVFAFATGVAGTFTACNVAAFSALASMAGNAPSRRGMLAQVARPLAVLAAGVVAVSALYGVIVALVGTRMPQFDESTGGSGLSPRLIQAMVVFGLIGLVMCYLGLAALGLVPDPLARVSKRFPNAPMLLLGVLFGAFLIGRPFPLFRRLFRDAAESGNILYGAAAFTLQALGNVLIMAVLFTVVIGLGGKRLAAWFTAGPGRAATVTAAAFIAAGVFLVLYWDLRILARRDLIWYPLAPWT